MNYTQKYYKEIFLKELQDALANGLISHQSEFENLINNKQDISNFYVMLLSIHAEVFEEVYNDLTLVYNSSKIDFATGSDLDDMGVIINCPRPPATRSRVELTFSVNSVDSEKTEPAGIIVSSSSGITYTTIEPVTLSAEQKSCTVPALAVNPGINSKVVEGQLTKLTSTLKNLNYVKVTNNNPSTGGTDAYSDDDYRELLKNWIKTKQKGNEWAYRDYFSRLDGLEDYKLVPNWDGTGTVKVILNPSDAYFLNLVYNDLQSEITQATEDIMVFAPVDKKIDIYIKCNVDIDRLNPFSSSEKTEISAKIKTQVKNYVNQMKIGEDFIPHKLAVFLDEHVSELKNITFNFPSSPIEITDEEKVALGNLEIEME